MQAKSFVQSNSMTKASTSEFPMAEANERGHYNEAFEFEPSVNNFEMKVQTLPSQGQHQDRDLKKKILKNLLLISVAFMVLFTSYESIAKLQSSINKARSSYKKHFSVILMFESVHTTSISTLRILIGE